jgi:hypothetical protein
MHGILRLRFMGKDKLWRKTANDGPSASKPVACFGRIDLLLTEPFSKGKARCETGLLIYGWVSKYREINFPTQY